MRIATNREKILLSLISNSMNQFSAHLPVAQIIDLSNIFNRIEIL